MLTFRALAMRSMVSTLARRSPRKIREMQLWLMPVLRESSEFVTRFSLSATLATRKV